MTSIPFVRDLAFDYGVAEQVSPLIRRIVAHNPSPFTFYGTGTYIVGRGSVAVIDPGPALPEHVDAILAALPGETVVESGAGAPALRVRWRFRRFRSGPQSGSRGHVSSPPLIKPDVRISRIRLSDEIIPSHSEGLSSAA